MNKREGVTLIEVMMCIVIFGLVIVIIAGSGASLTNHSVSFGINGLTEVRCINGFQFVVGDKGNARQVMNEFGKGARCQQ